MGARTGTDHGPNRDPNLVPMIDVLLVLLVIFMLMIPLNRRVIDIQLPDPIPRDVIADSPILLEVNPGNQYAINSEPVTESALDGRLREIYDPRPTKVLFVKGDSSVTWQAVHHVMDVARGAGVRVIGIPPKDMKRAH